MHRISLPFVTAFVERVLDVVDGTGSYQDDVPVAGSETILRTRKGIERFFISDINNPASNAKAASQIAISFDFTSTTASDFNHVPGGSNVLYMDGHVEFLKYPSDFPVTRVFTTFVALF